MLFPVTESGVVVYPKYFVYFWSVMTAMRKQNMSDKYNRFYNSIRFKYITSLLISLCLVLGSLLAYNYYSLQQVIQRNADQRANEMFHHVESATNSYLRFIVKTSELLEEGLQRGKFTEKELEQYIRNLLLDTPSIYACRIGLEPGTLQGHEDSFFMTVKHVRDIDTPSLMHTTIDYGALRTDDYLRAVNSQDAFFSIPHHGSSLDSVSVISYVLPILKDDAHGQTVVLGAIRIYLSIEWFNQWINDMVQYSDGFIAILGPENQLIVSSSSKIKGTSLHTITGGLDSFRLEDIIVEVSNQPDDESSFRPNKPGQHIGLKSLCYAGWRVMIVLNDELLFRGADELYADLIKIGVAGVLLVFFVIYIIISRITRPLSCLADSTNRIAEGDFDVQIPANKGRDEVGRLTHSMQTMIARLKILFSEMREKERMEGELNVARDIQKNILPDSYPAFSQLPAVDVYGKVQQAKKVGGDFFDYLLYKERYLIFAIGDVSGNGIPGALLMAVARTLFRANTYRFNTGEIASGMNKELCLGNESNMFVSMFIGILDSQTGMLQYTNAGHNYPFLKSADGSLYEVTQTHGIPLGMLDTLIYHSDEIQLSPYQTILLYTDGVIEAGGARHPLGVNGVREHLKSHPSIENARTMTSRLIQYVIDYISDYDSSVDDITVLTVKYIGNNPLTMTIDNTQEGIRSFQKKFFQYCTDHRIAESFYLKMNLVAEELLVNIITYAFVPEQSQKISIGFSCDGTGFRMTIKDDGAPFDVVATLQKKEDVMPNKQQIGGWGLFLVQHIVDEIKYVRLGDSNIVYLYKKLR